MFEICVSFGEPGLERCLAALREVDFAEIRLDRSSLSLDDVRTLFGSHPRLIVASKPDGGDDEKREAELRTAIESGAAYVDLELEMDSARRDRLLAAARVAGCRVIVSHHDFVRTPGRADLEAIREACFSAGADIAKIVCRVRGAAECARLLSLYDSPRPLIALALGETGFITRLAAPLLGAPFTYASLEPGKETADGQRPAAALRVFYDLLDHAQ